MTTGSSDSAGPNRRTTVCCTSRTSTPFRHYSLGVRVAVKIVAAIACWTLALLFIAGIGWLSQAAFGPAPI